MNDEVIESLEKDGWEVVDKDVYAGTGDNIYTIKKESVIEKKLTHITYKIIIAKENDI